MKRVIFVCLVTLFFSPLFARDNDGWGNWIGDCDVQYAGIAANAGVYKIYLVESTSNSEKILGEYTPYSYPDKLLSIAMLALSTGHKVRVIVNPNNKVIYELWLTNY